MILIRGPSPVLYIHYLYLQPAGLYYNNKYIHVLDRSRQANDIHVVKTRNRIRELRWVSTLHVAVLVCILLWFYNQKTYTVHLSFGVGTRKRCERTRGVIATTPAMAVAMVVRINQVTCRRIAKEFGGRLTYGGI